MKHIKNSDSEIHMRLRRRVERYLKRTGMSASLFGRIVANDPRFVLDLRCGRKVGPQLANKVRAWLYRRTPKRSRPDR